MTKLDFWNLINVIRNGSEDEVDEAALVLFVNFNWKDKIYLIKRPDHYWTTPYITLEEAQKELKELEGKPYKSCAWEIVEYELPIEGVMYRGKTIGASVCVDGKYKYLDIEALNKWQRE